MTVEAPERESMEQAFQAVAKELAKGRPWQAVAHELTQAGWQRPEAAEFVQGVERELREWERQQRASASTAGATTAHQAQGGALGSWVVYVGILIGINVLSYIFDWPFWVY